MKEINYSSIDLNAIYFILYPSASKAGRNIGEFSTFETGLLGLSCFYLSIDARKLNSVSHRILLISQRTSMQGLDLLSL